jgi:hypothetical protein
MGELNETREDDPDEDATSDEEDSVILERDNTQPEASESKRDGKGRN